MKKILTFATAASLFAACAPTQTKLTTTHSDAEIFSSLKDDYETCNDQNTQYDYYKECSLSLDEKFYSIGNKDSKYKIITILDNNSTTPKELKTQLKTLDSNYTNLINLSLEADLEILVLRKMLDIKPAQFKNAKGWSEKAAKQEVDELLDNIYKMVREESLNGNKVAIHAYGKANLMLNEYVYQYGTTEIESIVSLPSKIDATSMEITGETLYEQYTSKTFKKDYTKLLFESDLTKVTFISLKDSKIKLSKEEKEFAQNQNAQVVELESTKLSQEDYDQYVLAPLISNKE